MKFAGLWSLGQTGNGMQSFTGTDANVVASGNTLQINSRDGVLFSGFIQNLSSSQDVILVLQASLKSVTSQNNVTLHAREYLWIVNVPITNIQVKLNGTAILQGTGLFNEISQAVLAGLDTGTDAFSMIQTSWITVGKTAEQSFSNSPQWQQSAKSTNPAAGTTLSTVTVAAAAKGVILGIYINSPEANTFSLNWTSGGASKQKLYTIGAGNGGTILFNDAIAINNSTLADASTAVTIKNINAGTGDYQADILLASESA